MNKRYGFCTVPITKKGIRNWSQRELDIEAIQLFYELINNVNKKKDLRCHVCQEGEIDIICDSCDLCYCMRQDSCHLNESNRSLHLIHGVYHIDDCSSCRVKPISQLSQ